MLCLVVIAHHVLFLQMIKNDLLEAQYEYELDEFAEIALPGTIDQDTAPGAIDKIARLERRLKVNQILRLIFLLGGLAAFVASYFFRNKRGANEFPGAWEDEWDEDDWEDES